MEMGQLHMLISIVFPLIHMLTVPVDNRSLSVDNQAGLGITLTGPLTLHTQDIGLYRITYSTSCGSALISV